MPTQPLTRAIAQSLTHRLTDSGAGGGVFDPASLFAAGEQGIWYDPSDLSTMFQDAAGTVPVTGAGQPVGRILDKSGRGNHATQATTANKPILQSIGGKLALVFDGVDDSLSTGSIDFTSTDKVTVVAGVRKLSDAYGCIVEASSNALSTQGAFGLLSAGWASAGAKYGAAISGTAGSFSMDTPATFPAPRSDVLSVAGDIAGAVAADELKIRVSGVAVAGTVSGDAIGIPGTLGNNPLYIGRRGGTSLPFNGHLYQLTVRGAATADLAPIESFTADKTGVTL